MRRIDLDWLRIIAFALLIGYHVALLYVPWPYHAKSRSVVPALEPVLLLLNPWRLLLLFLISGVATRFMAERLDGKSLLKNRSMRLLIPLLFGILVVVPPQSYVQAIEQFGFEGSFADFYMHKYLLSTGKLCKDHSCLILPTWNHLWFILYLYVYTVILLIVDYLKSYAALSGVRIAAAWTATSVMLLPITVLISIHVLLADSFPPNDAFVADWFNHAKYLFVFAVGYATAKDSSFWDAIDRTRRSAMTAAAVCGLVIFAVWSQRSELDPRLSSWVFAVGTPIYQWSALVTVLGLGRRLLPSADGPLRRYLTEAIFPFYIVHQTAIVIASYELRDEGLSIPVEAAIIIAVTALACWMTFEVVRRVPYLRILFGLKAHTERPPSTLA